MLPININHFLFSVKVATYVDHFDIIIKRITNK